MKQNGEFFDIRSKTNSKYDFITNFYPDYALLL